MRPAVAQRRFTVTLSPEMQPLLERLTAQVHAAPELTPEEIEAAVAELTTADLHEDSAVAFLRALAQRGETPGEIVGFARLLRERAREFPVDPARLPGPILDVCGTGGDGVNTFNISTTTAFVLAAGGAVVAKHGGRANSSRSGGVDVLAALGIRVAGVPPAETRGCLEEHGLCFLFAPDYHPAFAAGVKARRRLAQERISTIFNLLGPILNPAREKRQLLGVFTPRLLPKMAEVFRLLERDRAWAIHGTLGATVPTGGMDELSVLGDSLVSRWEHGAVAHGAVTPEAAGLPRYESIETLRGGDPAENARITAGILAGEISGAPRDVVLLNAAAGFVIVGLEPDLGAGVERARAQIRDGRALAKLRALQAF